MEKNGAKPLPKKAGTGRFSFNQNPVGGRQRSPSLSGSARPPIKKRKEESFLREQYHILRQKESDSYFFVLKERLTSLIPDVHHPRIQEISDEYRNLFSGNSLENLDKEVIAIENGYLQLVDQLESHTSTLKNDNIFSVYNLFTRIFKNRDIYKRSFDTERKGLVEQVEKIKIIKDCISKNKELERMLGNLGKYLKQVDGLQMIIKSNMSDGFVRKKRSNTNVLLEFDNLVKLYEDELEDFTTLLSSLENIYLRDGYLSNYFVDRKPLLLEVIRRWDEHKAFFGEVRIIDSVVIKLMLKLRLSEFEKRQENIRKQQVLRMEWNDKIEEDFRKVNLKNDKEIERYQKLNRTLEEETCSFLEVMKKQLSFIEASFSQLKVLEIKGDDCHDFQENLLREFLSIKKQLQGVGNENRKTLAQNESYYGKIYEVEKNKVLGIKVKKKRLVYFGQMKGGKRDGIGKEFYEDQRTVKFYGKFSNGEKAGTGEEYNRKGELTNKVENLKESTLKIHELPKLMEAVDPIKDLLGKGSYGEVYKIMIDEKLLALKRLFLSKKKNVQEISRIKNEVRLLSKLKHKNIISLYGYAEYEDENSVQFGLIFEYCPGKILYNGMKFYDKIAVLSQISDGMDFLHKYDIMHRDLKMENLLVKDGVIKIIDFGLSKQIESYRLTQRLSKNAMGTAGYTAPELLEGNKKYTTKVDVFSFSMIMYCIYFETDDPYNIEKNDDSFYAFKIDESVLQGMRPEIPNRNFTQENEWYIKLMVSCWQADPDERPTFSFIKELFNSKLKEIKK